MTVIFTRILFIMFIACAALLVSSSNVNRRSMAGRRSMNLPNCVEMLIGNPSGDVIMLSGVTTDPYQAVTAIENADSCKDLGMRLVGALLATCDPLGPPAPTVNSESILSQTVHCHSEGPCPAGLTVSVSQYCMGYLNPK